ncbi:hypothetical protein BCV70DRAFT_154999 [Testicularia cyperi]|uniref:Uncharacterized protein n=1 Tax=Testicularia cyperi TaxID=1882483 RepID=A0A317Y0W1_9BASI|nr:hypothetical protein BCV70DRAFT_154999 [Testicularia cyperi]
MEAAFRACSVQAVFEELKDGLEPFVFWHVTESVQEGYSPEAIGELQEEAEVEALILERRSRARDRAIGLFAALLHKYLTRHEGTDLEAALACIVDQIGKGGSEMGDMVLETDRIYEYIDRERQKGGWLEQDPSWNWIDGIKANKQWTAEFKESLQRTFTAYVETCKRFQPRFEAEAQKDLELLEALQYDGLHEMLSRLAPRTEALPVGPASPVTPETNSFWNRRLTRTEQDTYDSDKLACAGSEIRQASQEMIARRLNRGVEASVQAHLTALLNGARNLESDPEQIIRRAIEKASSLKLESDAHESESDLREVKDALTQAIEILGARDGTRNTDLVTQAYNARAGINHKLAGVKKSPLNYYRRALSDWRASLDRDSKQPDVQKEVQGLEKRVQELEVQQKGDESAAEASAKVLALSDDNREHGAAHQGIETRVDRATVVAKSQPREKTILESPFFRSDLVMGLMVDALLSLPFPHRAFRESLKIPIEAFGGGDGVQNVQHAGALQRAVGRQRVLNGGLTEENKLQMDEAAKGAAAVLALPQHQLGGRMDDEILLRVTSLRLLHGNILLLKTDAVRAQAELELASNALKNKLKRVESGLGSVEGRASKPESTPPAKSADQVSAMLKSVQGHLLLLLAKAASMRGDSHAANRFWNWLCNWAKDQDPGKHQLNMLWWDKLVVVTKP